MEFIKQWAMLLCVMCVLYSVLEGILPQKEPYPVIKLAGTLYILIVLLSPARQQAFKDIKFDVPDIRYEAQGYEALENSTQEYTERLLCTRLEEYLESTGCTGCRVQVTLYKAKDGDLSVECVYIYAPQGENQEELKQKAEEFFGCKVNCITEVTEYEGQ